MMFTISELLQLAMAIIGVFGSGYLLACMMNRR